MHAVQPISLHEATRERYLSYALSVITARALPDVRDGLKPVQRRILYTMFHELTLHPNGRYRKSAAVVGEVMGKYHPHGDQSIYDALVRMAQDFSLRDPLVDPQGNFGSLDGDPPAAMRYTECKLTAIAEELLQEIGKETVDFRSTYDGQRSEPIVLPAQFPQLLVNGVEGIAVGLSTRIPPHNLSEIIDGCVAMIDGEAHSVADLLRYIKGPDFPTAGRVLNDLPSLQEIYETGRGSIRIRGEWREEKDGRREQVIITSIPYAQNKAKLVEKIGQDVTDRKLPQVVDVRDESTDEIRIVLDLKAGASAEAVMAYLYRRTPLESTFPVNMNALVPTERPEVAVPERLDLHGMLQYWLDFRYATVRRRFEFDLARLRERIHLLEGFAILFADIDEAVRLIRQSDGKKDAARRLMEAFPLDELQTEAILELKLYKLARLEIRIILDELEEKRAEAAEIERMLASEALLWSRVRSELLEIQRLYASPRKTTIGEPVQQLEFDDSAYIVREETFVVVTREGWIKRQSSFTDLQRIRVRDNDEIGWLLHVDTASSITFIASDGRAYTLRVGDIGATTGYGVPLQRQFQLADGATVVGVVPHDERYWRHLPEAPAAEQTSEAEPEDEPPPPYLVSVTAEGRIQRSSLAIHAEPSTRVGRMLARLSEGDSLIAAYVAGGGEWAAVATEQGNALAFPIAEAAALKAPGKGTTAIKLKDDDRVFAFELCTDERTGLVVQTNNGRVFEVTPRTCGGARAARGKSVIRRGGLGGWKRPVVVFTGRTTTDTDAPAAAPAEGEE
jgi:DNA gyrase subunit A